MYNMSCYVNFNDLEEKFLDYVKENNIDNAEKWMSSYNWNIF